MKIEILCVVIFWMLLMPLNLLAQNKEISIAINARYIAENKIEISFDLPPLPNKKSSYKVSLNATFDGEIILTTALSGDIGEGVKGGKRNSIIWDSTKDVIEVMAGTVFKVSAKIIHPQPKFNHLVIGASIMPSTNFISFNKDDIQSYRFNGQPVELKSTLPFVLDFSANMTYFFNKKIGIGIDLGYHTYAQTLKVTDFNTTYTDRDIDSHAYDRSFEVKELEEAIKVKYLSATPHISLVLSSREKRRSILSIGWQMGFGSKGSFQYKGTFTGRNQYTDNWGGSAIDEDFAFTLLATDTDGDGTASPSEAANSHYNLYENQLLESDSDQSLETQNTQALTLTWATWLKMSEHIYFSLAPQLTYGLGNTFTDSNLQQTVEDNLLLKSYDDYRSLASASEKSNRLGLGLQIGLQYAF